MLNRFYVGRENGLSLTSSRDAETEVATHGSVLGCLGLVTSLVSIFRSSGIILSRLLAMLEKHELWIPLVGRCNRCVVTLSFNRRVDNKPEIYPISRAQDVNSYLGSTNARW